MTVRVEKLRLPTPSFLTLAVLGIISSATASVLRWWQEPAPMVMSEDWINEHARTETQHGWD
jgi:hypothetical protein